EEHHRHHQAPSFIGETEKSILGTVGLFFLELIKVAILAGVTIGLVRYFLFKPFYVKGQSMEPTFYEHEYLIIDEITYRFREPVRGEIVVFRAPNNPNDYYLKRVVGLPGERVKIEDNRIVIYNTEHPQGALIEEVYLDDKTRGSISETLEADEYFVLGDNRSASYDSRQFGPIKRSSIIGRTWLRGWPFTRITTFRTPDYNL
ncbi:MAG TPA: signal peptidase I, partial [Candidatus Kapabacteria bacterium]|nr:signal peptidase I [Candidatus Kapabacteria bacterium]